MSGTGKKQRTKGNVKPSSSARAAELLTAAGYGIPSTIGFMGFDAIPASADFEGSSLSAGNVDEPEDLDEDFRVVFRKAMKKDAMTKMKALREVASLVSDKETKVVLTAWQCWPRLYSKLALDGNFKVRELAHTVLGSFAQKLTRQIASQLKSIVPYWLMGEHDPYQVAAQAARQTFQDAFPAGKRPQQCSALVFTIDDGAVAGSSAVDTAEESSETRAIRLSSCSISALHALLSTITEDELTSVQESLNQALFSSPKFWKMGDKAKPNQVRVAWFNLALCLIRRRHALLSEKANKLVPVIVNGLEETDGSVVGLVWGCFANYVNLNSEEFWKNCNFRKAFMPKFAAVIRKAFNWCSRTVADSVSVAIRSLPSDDDMADVYGKLLNSFHAGCLHILDSKVSSSEAAAFVRIYSEFVKTILIIRKVTEFSKDFLIHSEKSLFVISSYMKSTSPLLSLEVFQHLATMVAMIIDELSLKEPDLVDAVAAYQSNLYQAVLLELQVKTSPNSLSNLLAALENRSVNFKPLCTSICRNCSKLYDENGDADYLKIFRDVLCASADILYFIAKFEDDEDPTVASDKFVDLLLNRLQRLDNYQTTGTLQVGYALDCCFSVLPVLDTSRKTDFLKRLCQIHQFEIQYQLITKLRLPSNEPLLQYVPKSEFCALFMDFFKSVCLLVSNDSDSEEQRKQWRLISEYLAGASTQGTLIPTHVAATALEHLSSLVGADSIGRNLSFIVALVAQLASDAVVIHKNLLTEKAGHNLVEQLFDLYCSHSDDLSEEALYWTKRAWTSAISAHINSRDEWVTHDSATFLSFLTQRLLVHVRKAALNRDKLEWLCSVAVDVISACKNAQPKPEDDALRSVVSHLLSADTDSADVGGCANEWMFNAALSGRFPLYDLTICDSDFTRGVDYTDRDAFLNLAAYGLRFAYFLNSEDSPLGIPSTSLLEPNATVALRGFSAIAYIVNTYAPLSDCSHLTSLKQVGSWMILIAIDFWNSLKPDERRNVARMATKTILASSNALATQAMEFLQHDLERADFLTEGLRHDNWHVVAMLCAAPLLLENQGNFTEPQIFSPAAVSGYLNLAANHAIKRLSVFDWIMTVKTEFLDANMLFSCDVSNADGETVVLNISLMRYFEKVVYCLSEMSNEQRDFLLCATLTWLQSCAESDLTRNRIQLFAYYTVRLFIQIATFMDSIKDDPNTSAVAEEWTGFFLKGCVQIIVPMLFKLANGNCSTPLHLYLLREASAAVRYARHEDVMDLELPPLLAPELDNLGYPERLQTLLLNAFPLLENRIVSVQIGSFSIVDRLVDQFCGHESKSGKETDGNETRELPSYFLNTLQQTYDLIESDFDAVHHLEESPAFSSYFLTWKLLLKFFATVKTEDRPAYSQALSSSKILDKLMLTLLSVLPENVSATSKNPLPDASGSDVERTLLEYETSFEHVELKSTVDTTDVSRVFLEASEYKKDMPITRYVQQYSCHILFEVLRLFPAAVRHWFNRQEKKVSNLLERFTAKYVSPLLCSFELQAITKAEKKYDNMTLIARPAAREVVACYKLEELTMELVVTLPKNYPLTAAVVDVNHRVGVSVEQWRKWMLQLTVFLSHQNGGLLDGMLLWKRCIDKHLQGVEDCMICMMAVHGSTYQLPKITCKQCKKKFHAACLYKWFNTSSNTSCPLCRTTF